MKSKNSVKISFHNVFDALKSHLLSTFMQLSGEQWVDRGHDVAFAGHRTPTGAHGAPGREIRAFHLAVLKNRGRPFRALSYFLSLSCYLLRRKRRYDLIYCRFIAEERLRDEGYLDSRLVRATWRMHLSGRRDHGHALWTVLSLQAWLEQQRHYGLLP